MGELSGKVALVTGGGRGIGRSTAIALAGAGADLAVCSRTQAELGWGRGGRPGAIASPGAWM